MSAAEGAERPSWWRRLIAFGWDLWETLRRPSSVFSLGVLVLAGFVAGVIFWGGFNTALELTNTEKFCTGCHEMRDNVFAELKSTIHFSNRSGVRASCPDCHGPHEWARLKANDSLECRNCHSIESMDVSKQSARASAAHERFLLPGEKTCI